MKKDRGPVRISDWLQSELNKIKAAEMQQGRSAPSNADLLDHAWMAFQHSEQNQTSDIADSNISTGTNPFCNSALSESVLKTEKNLQCGENVIKISTSELKWVEKLLTVLRSGSKRFIRAVTSNLDVFEGYAQEDAERGDGQTKTKPAEKTRGTDFDASTNSPGKGEGSRKRATGKGGS